MGRLQRVLAALGKFGEAAESGLLVVLLMSMVLLSAAQILLRNAFDVGFYWSDELLRMLVLWVALAGAVAASRTDKHISINLLDSLLNGRALLAAKCVVHAFSAAICGLVTRVSIAFLATSREYGDVLLGGVPAWMLQLVLPLGFGLICYRYVLFFINDLIALAGGKGKQEPAE